jgi:hypothetical protein
MEAEPIPSPSSIRQSINNYELDKNFKRPCGYGKTCTEKSPLHFKIYRHPKDVEDSEDDIKMEDENEILGKFQNQKLQGAEDYKLPDEGSIIKLMDMEFTREQAIKALKMTDNNIERAVGWIIAHSGDDNQKTASGSQLQEAKDHEIAMHLSQASDSEDEYDKICNKPSAAFETNNTASVFDEAELSENEGIPAPSTSYALPNRHNEIPDFSDEDDVIAPKVIY